MSSVAINSTKSPKSAKSSRTANVGISTLVPELIKLLDKSEARLGPEPPAITTNQKKRFTKVRKGAEKVIETIAPIVQQYGLDSASLHSETMVARHTDAQTLLPLQKRLQKMQKRVDDELFNAQNQSWDMALQFYALLQRRALTDGDVANSLAPVAQLFTYRHPLVKAGHPTKVQTRAKAKLKDALALAERHGVPTAPAPVKPATIAEPTGPTVSVSPTFVPTPVAAPVATTAQPVAPAPMGGATNAGNGVTNGATNAVANGAANGVTNGAVTPPRA